MPRPTSPLPSLAGLLSGARAAWGEANEAAAVSRSRVLLLAGLGAAVGLTEAMFLAILASAGVALAGDGMAAVRLPFAAIEGLSIPALLIIGTGLALTTLGAQFLIQVSIARISSETVATLRRATYQDFVETGWAVQRSEMEGTFLSYMITHIPKVASVLTSVITELTAAITLTVFILAAVLISPFIALAVVVLGGLMFCVFLPVQGVARRAGRESSAATRVLFASLVDAIAASREIKSYGVEAAVAERIDHEIDAVERPAYRSRLLNGIVPVIYQRFVFLLLLGGLAMVYALDITELGSIGAALLLVLRAMQQGQIIQSQQQSIAEARPWIGELRERRAHYRANVVRSGTTPLSAVETIEFRNVSYEYDDGTVALDDVSFAARRGELIGLIGPSGSGKSTLSELIARLEQPTAGSYLVNGVDCWEFDSRMWTEQVVLVPQLGQLIAGSVADNIRFLRDGISQEALVDASVRSHLLNEIEDLDDGFATLIGERGHRGLSGGQRQRLSIARAVARTPSLVVLDEPTSALDHQAEEVIVETIEQLREHACVVVIAHRLSTLRHCDRVLVLRDGKREAFCTLDELPQESEFFRVASATNEL